MQHVFNDRVESDLIYFMYSVCCLSKITIYCSMKVEEESKVTKALQRGHLSYQLTSPNLTSPHLTSPPPPPPPSPLPPPGGCCPTLPDCPHLPSTPGPGKAHFNHLPGVSPH